MAVSFELNLAKYKYSKSDTTGAPGTTYYGFSTHPGATNATEEWAILRETVAGAITTYSWADHDGKEPKQLYAWDDRAGLSY